MAQQTQQYMLAEFIEKVKRENYRKDDPYYLDESTPITSNRGNKLNRVARQVTHGRLNSNTLFQQRINHAGYTRNVISINPPYYTPDGDIVEAESEIEDDDEPLEENIYKDVKLEDVLAPLASAAELPSHPSLSRPYREQGLEEMIRKAEDALHKEQEILYTIKAIYTEFRGDLSWAPMGMFQDAQSEHLLSRTTKVSSIPVVGVITAANTTGDTTVVNGDMEAATRRNVLIQAQNGKTADVRISEAALMVNGDHTTEPMEVVRDVETTHDDTEKATENGTSTGTMQSEGIMNDNGVSENRADGSTTSAVAEDAESSTAPSHRMRTRAQANHGTQSPSTQSISSASFVPPIDAFYSFPTIAIPDHTQGLPQQMADETCLALSTYISKQEEIVRSLRELHSGLLRGLKMRQDIWKWSKAEGHVGEMSDNEDWVDLDEWGIDPRDSRIKYTKGQQEEDQVDEEEERRGKRVRRAGRTAKE